MDANLNEQTLPVTRKAREGKDSHKKRCGKQDRGKACR